ncbi:hypothetical protein FACS189438_2270 [Bacteroidia bacterium]|nr:hypothetical protein FACS189438_2270 [Bacteroidia bacterium]
MNEKLKDQDVLLVKEKGSNELHAVNLDKNGKVKSSKLDGSENPDFLKIDKNGNALENFFENFKRQIKDPTRFDFYRAPLEKLGDVVKRLYEAFKSPDKPENKDFLDVHRIEPEDFQKKQANEQRQTEGQTKSYAINPDLVDWQKFERFGITREALEKSGNLDKLLDYQKTNLMPVAMKFDSETLRSDARFSLRKQEDGTFAPAVHLIRSKPDLERPYFGVEFTKEDKENLLKTGNLGRVVEAEFKQGEKTPVLISLDKQTNELVAFRKEWLKVPETYKGVPLSEETREKLGNGKKVNVENMTTNDGSKQFSANVQFNADKRYFELVFDNDRKQNQNLKQGEAPKTFRKKQLTEDQQSSVREGKTVHTGELTDRNGKKYSGYITLNKETGKYDFMFPKDYRDALAAGKVIPDDRHKVQVAKNNNGNTTEATKNIKEPLNSGQTQPTEKQTEKQAAKQEEKKEVKKSKGVKM